MFYRLLLYLEYILHIYMYIYISRRLNLLLIVALVILFNLSIPNHKISIYIFGINLN